MYGEREGSVEAAALSGFEDLRELKCFVGRDDEEAIAWRLGCPGCWVLGALVAVLLVHEPQIFSTTLQR